MFLVVDTVSTARILAKLTYLRLEELLSSGFWTTPYGWSTTDEESSLKSRAKTLYMYTHAVRRLQFLGTASSNSKGLMNPWSSYLYLASSCYPNITYLHIIRCSLAWWFRIDFLNNLSELVLEECEIDESGIEIFANNCPHIRIIRFLSTNVRTPPDDLPHLKDLSKNNPRRTCPPQESPRRTKLTKCRSFASKGVLFADLKEICIKSCHDGVDMLTIYFFLLTCPNIRVIRFADSKFLKDIFYPNHARLEIIKNEEWYVIMPYSLEDIKKIWSIPRKPCACNIKTAQSYLI